jgi:hypothetical protein
VTIKHVFLVKYVQVIKNIAGALKCWLQQQKLVLSWELNCEELASETVSDIVTWPCGRKGRLVHVVCIAN